MDEPLSLETVSEDNEHFKQAIDEMFQKMEQADQRISPNQLEVDRLKFETQALLKELKATA